MPNNTFARPQYRCRPDSIRRSEERLLCSDLIRIRWGDGLGERHEEVVVLEGCSVTGASLFTGVALGEGIGLTLCGGKEELKATVRHCVAVPNGYLTGVNFVDRSLSFVPRHLLDPSRLVATEKPWPNCGLEACATTTGLSHAIARLGSKV